ncbi:MAG: ABC transporter ATP-binding protein [Mesorhizobium sp.]|uniref:ABC transporter ATP-binding protein n=1 Tax=Mesorhizobium sp. TaxID=1871066 RepID=UPI000FE93499|nr:ABC transporter ATP-binding protein [Mesorhizobium sp.]RWN37314.1 MAG: ABC transporter ATP-binding protein [Mesorhizobium sp.]RWN63546.1 MAG: ABC transporter ATP-binding protein [Mesorhizobium sp.]RWQ44182.1 MAG: ABC transporter ATP-binding protein [Mesorhizobium sp.]
MVSIKLDNVSLIYKLRGRLTLSAPDRRVGGPGGRIQGNGRNQIVQALDGISFELKAGDRLGLVGPNGAGKTTLLKVLYGIYEPSGGSVIIEGKVDALFNINIGFRREATGRRNIVLRGLISGWTEAEIEEKMEEIIAFSELGDFIDLPFKAYSQGMAARLAFSASTSLDPEILLMDEWIGAGDASFQDKAKRRMDELAEKAGIIVLASHNENLIDSVCTKKMTLKSGRIEALAGVPAQKAVRA